MSYPQIVHCMEDPFDIYIGRSHPRFPNGSKWANPFKIGQDGNRIQVLKKFELWLPQQADLMISISELKDKILGCWCKSHKNPKPCHGEILAKFCGSDVIITDQAQNQITDDEPTPTGLQVSKRKLSIPAGITVGGLVSHLEQCQIKLGVHKGRLSYPIPNQFLTASVESIIEKYESMLIGLVGGCAYCKAYAANMIPAQCFFDAYFLGKAGKAKDASIAKATCELNSKML